MTDNLYAHVSCAVSVTRAPRIACHPRPHPTQVSQSSGAKKFFVAAGTVSINADSTCQILASEVRACVRACVLGDAHHGAIGSPSLGSCVCVYVCRCWSA